MQLFHIGNTSKFLHLPLECGKCDTSRTPVTPRATTILQQPKNQPTNRVNQKETKNDNNDCVKLIVIGQRARKGKKKAAS